MLGDKRVLEALTLLVGQLELRSLLPLAQLVEGVELSSVIIVVVIVVELSITIFACFIQCCHHTLKFRVLPGDIISVAEQVFNPIMAVESTDEVKIGIFLLEFERLF